MKIPKPNEHLKRSALKITTHRIGSLVITFGSLMVMGANIPDTIVYTLGINAVKTIADICYERIWVRLKWGYKI